LVLIHGIAAHDTETQSSGSTGASVRSRRVTEHYGVVQQPLTRIA
jgi:hypothetical protein